MPAVAVIVAVPLAAHVTVKLCSPVDDGGVLCETGVIVTMPPPSVSEIVTGPLS